MDRERRITIRDVAKAAGYSKSAVSLALRNHPSLPDATKNRIREAAERLGYRPDPTLRALAHYRYGNTATGAPVIAWLSNWPSRDQWKQGLWGEHFAGAVHQAEQLGYRIEHFWLREPNLTIARLEQVLLTRSIRGLIIAPQPIPHPEITLSWERYAAVSIGYSLQSPAVHRVVSFHYRSMSLVARKLRERGYRRVGFITTEAIEVRNESALRASFLVEANPHGDPPVPPLSIQPKDRTIYERWQKKYKPDAIAVTDLRLAMTIRKWSEEMKKSIPRDLGLVVLFNVPADSDITGIHEHPRQIGATAVNVLGSLLFHNALGLPDVPTCTMIDGSWVEGRTVRAAPPRT